MATTAGNSGWSVAKHDTIPSVEYQLDPPETHVYLSAFIAADGSDFAPPYTDVREKVALEIAAAKRRERPKQPASADVSDQRLRTWRAVFESFGFLFIDEAQRIRLTPLGRLAQRMSKAVEERVAGANDHLAKLGVTVLGRHVLRNPLESTEYPADTDTRPYRLIWRAMRQLENRLHWEELNRVLMKTFHRRDESAAIEKIRAARKKGGAGYPRPTDLTALGAPSVDEGAETKRRITPWFTQAGFGGLLITPDDDEMGFRHLVDRYIPLIDEALQAEPPAPTSQTMSSRSQYIQYLSQGLKLESEEANTGDEFEIDRALTAIKRHGRSKIVCLSGLPGTGKSRLAKLVATRLVESDPYRYAEIQFHESTSYDDFVEGFVPRASGGGFELRPKIFRVMNRRARLDPEGRPVVIVIEEFTRANVHAILGELITYIEHRARPFTLALSQETEEVAPNLVMLATMNPKDKSALVLDHAILRRMYRIDIDSSGDKLRQMLAGKLEQAVLDRLAEWFDTHRLALPFGHAEFSEVGSETDLRDLWTGNLRHFLTDWTGAIRPDYEDAANDYPWR